MVEEALFPPGASPPHINNLHTPNGKFSLLASKLNVGKGLFTSNSSSAHSGATVNQLLRRAAAAAAMRRERNNSSHSDELSLKRHRPDNGIPGNNNSPDVVNHMPQVTATDFSTIKHNNNNTPPIKDSERIENHSGMSHIPLITKFNGHRTFNFLRGSSVYS